MRNISKKTWIIVLCICLMIIGVIFFMVIKNQHDARLETVKLDNGDSIAFQKTADYTEGTGVYDEHYAVLTDKAFAEKFPEQANNKAVVHLPKETLNLGHSYQLKNDQNGQPSGDYDEIYQWETGVYKDAQSKILYNIMRSKGRRDAVADRGYMELTLYKDMPQRLLIRDENSLGAEANFQVKSRVNQKTAIITETLAEYNSDRRCYLAEITDLDGKGTNGFFTADNVTREDFIAMVETLVGRDYPMPKKIGGAQNKEADSKDAFIAAKHEIKCMDTAEKIIYAKYREEIKANGFKHWIYTDYFADTKKEDGKSYNVLGQIGVGDYSTEKRYTCDWYMYLEKNEMGTIVEKGKPLIKTFK